MLAAAMGHGRPASRRTVICRLSACNSCWRSPARNLCGRRLSRGGDNGARGRTAAADRW